MNFVYWILNDGCILFIALCFLAFVVFEILMFILYLHQRIFRSDSNFGLGFNIETIFYVPALSTIMFLTLLFLPRFMLDDGKSSIEHFNVDLAKEILSEEHYIEFGVYQEEQKQKKEQEKIRQEQEERMKQQ